MRRATDRRRVLIRVRPIVLRPQTRRFESEPFRMPDALYIALGVIVLLIFALYAAGLRRI
jgi:hypothetical protein